MEDYKVYNEDGDLLFGPSKTIVIFKKRLLLSS